MRIIEEQKDRWRRKREWREQMEREGEEREKERARIIILLCINELENACRDKMRDKFLAARRLSYYRLQYRHYRYHSHCVSFISIFIISVFTPFFQLSFCISRISD